VRRPAALLAAFFAGSAVFGLWSLSAAGAQTSGTPSTTLTIVTANPTLTQVQGRWTTTVFVQDVGPCVPSITFGLVSTTAGFQHYAKGRVEVRPRPPAGCALSADKVSKVTIRFVRHMSVVPIAAQLVVAVPAETATFTGSNTLALVIQRPIGIFWELWFPLCMGLVLAFAFAIAFWVIACWKKAGGGVETAKASSTWSFKDSWATNLTVLGAGFAAVITATGAVTSVFPGVPLYRFAILNAAYAATGAIAPLVATLGRVNRDDAGTAVQFSKRSLLCAGGLTLLALGAELATLATLAFLSSAVTWAGGVLMAVLSLVGVLAVCYAVPATTSLFATGNNHRFFSAERSAMI